MRLERERRLEKAYKLDCTQLKKFSPSTGLKARPAVAAHHSRSSAFKDRGPFQKYTIESLDYCEAVQSSFLLERAILESFLERK